MPARLFILRISFSNHPGHRPFTDTMTRPISDGFEPWHPSNPFMTNLAGLGAFYRRSDSNVLAMRVAAPHTNMHNIAHGGLLATLADSGAGLLHRARGPGVRGHGADVGGIPERGQARQLAEGPRQHRQTRTPASDG